MCLHSLIDGVGWHTHGQLFQKIPNHFKNMDGKVQDTANKDRLRPWKASSSVGILEFANTLIPMPVMEMVTSLDSAGWYAPGDATDYPNPVDSVADSQAHGWCWLTCGAFPLSLFHFLCFCIS